MRISFDLDGVLADMDAALAKIARQELGASADRRAPSGPAPAGEAGGREAVPAERGPATAAAALPASAILERLTAREQALLWQRVRNTRDFWETLAEHEPGAIRRIQDLAYRWRWEVLFVTQRPPTVGRTAQVQSQRWLHKHGFDLPAVYTTRGSRGRMAEALALDVHLDDRLENALDVASESEACSILVWRDESTFAEIAARARRLNIAIVRTVAEALEQLEAAELSVHQASPGTAVPPEDDVAAEAAALFAGLRRAFGFGKGKGRHGR